MEKRRIFLILFAAIMIAILLLNIEYGTSRAKSLIIKDSIEDIPGQAPNGTYPLILIHGQNPTYSGRISEYSLKEMQESLSSNLGYQNRGILTSDTTCAELKYSSTPISVRATYLSSFELMEIEDYAIKVDSIISKVKYCTGAEKVDIVTHSMGGIITRYYIKNIDNSSVRKVIMLASPNQGRVYKIGDLAPILIEEGESILPFDFLQMTDEHNFIPELNSGDQTPGDALYYNIEGYSGDGKGDGVVIRDAVTLQGEAGYSFVECSHLEIKYPSKCPDAYENVKEFLAD